MVKRKEYQGRWNPRRQILPLRIRLLLKEHNQVVDANKIHKVDDQEEKP